MKVLVLNFGTPSTNFFFFFYKKNFFIEKHQHYKIADASANLKGH